MIHLTDPERDEPGGLHDALDAETGGLGIGVPPTAAVLRDGRALRHRRRAGLAGGVAVLAALPVAATGMLGGGPGPVVSAGGAAPTATAPSAVPLSPPGPLPSALIPAPPLPATGAPDPADHVQVLGTGTFQGRPYRLVRDQFVISGTDAKAAGSATVAHLPFADRRNPDDYLCEYIGPQFGDQPAGTRPDFQAVSGGCAHDGSKAYEEQLYSLHTLSLDPATKAPIGLFTVLRLGPDITTGVTATLGTTTVPETAFHAAGETGTYWLTLLPADHSALTVPGAEVTQHISDRNGVVSTAESEVKDIKTD